MIHHQRRFSVTVIDSIEELVRQLTHYTRTLCTCLEYQGLYLANDSFSENGAQEYAVYKEGRQRESLTVSWMTPARLREVIEGLRRGDYDDMEFRPTYRLQTEPASEHRCGLCQ
jgi:hypothetical protein